MSRPDQTGQPRKPLRKAKATGWEQTIALAHPHTGRVRSPLTTLRPQARQPGGT